MSVLKETQAPRSPVITPSVAVCCWQMMRSSNPHVQNVPLSGPNSCYLLLISPPGIGLSVKYAGARYQELGEAGVF